MKKTPSSRDEPLQESEGLQPEYNFDYRKAKPNRFIASSPRIDVPDKEVAKNITTTKDPLES